MLKTYLLSSQCSRGKKSWQGKTERVGSMCGQNLTLEYHYNLTPTFHNNKHTPTKVHIVYYHMQNRSVGKWFLIGVHVREVHHTLPHYIICFTLTLY